MSKTAERIAEARYFESEFGAMFSDTVLDLGPVASRCKCCDGMMSKRTHADAESSWRRCNNCGDVRPIFTRVDKKTRAILAILDAEWSNR